MSPGRLPSLFRHKRRMVAIAVVILSIAGVALARCDVDGGLLDPDSAASESQRVARQQKSDDAFRRLHQTDVYNDVADFVGAIDSGIKAVDAAAKTSPPATPVPAPQAADQAHAYLGRLTRSARAATARINATPAPVWHRPLIPDTSPGYWITLHAAARSAFTTFVDSIENVNDELNDPTVFADNARSRAVADRIDAAATALGDDINTLMKDIVIPTEATRTEIEHRGYFADTDRGEKNTR